MGRKTRRKGPSLPQQEAYTLTSLDQVKVLADPLRIRILEAFCEERTTRQVADLLGEKPTKLYHHVDALERVGLIALTRTRQNRGTVEKYFLAVARTFRADARVFQPGGAGSEDSSALRGMLANIFDTTAAELVALAERGGGAADALGKEAMVSFLDIRASAAQLEEIQRKLHDIIQSLSVVEEDAALEDRDIPQGRYRLTLAYYPLDTNTRAQRG